MYNVQLYNMFTFTFVDLEDVAYIIVSYIVYFNKHIQIIPQKPFLK